ncbi:hypothetical protein TNCV_3904391 [Trichonephila clavipes]|nr:hypothetical protein TNCV_3904391 [Trichonephila clavipes]
MSIVKFNIRFKDINTTMTSADHNLLPIIQTVDGASAVCQDPDTVLIRVESMIESPTNSDVFRSRNGTMVRTPDVDFNIIPRSVTVVNRVRCRDYDSPNNWSLVLHVQRRKAELGG